jgi:hypothetical protein
MPILHWECDRCGRLQSTEPGQSGPKYALTVVEDFRAPSGARGATHNWWLCAACWDGLALALQRGPGAVAHV